MEALWREQLDAQVDNADTCHDALTCLSRNGAPGYDVVLVNRVLAADGSSGLEVIRQIVELGKSAPPVMLVSDLPDAQDLAVGLGAIPGFGKSELGEPSTFDRVRQAAHGLDPMSHTREKKKTH